MHKAKLAEKPGAFTKLNWFEIEVDVPWSAPGKYARLS